MRDVRDKKRKKLIRAYTERVASVLYYLGPLSIDINAKNVKNDKILRELGLLNFNVFPHLIQECEKLGDYVVNVVEARMGVRQHEA